MLCRRCGLGRDRTSGACKLTHGAQPAVKKPDSPALPDLVELTGIETRPGLPAQGLLRVAQVP